MIYLYLLPAAIEDLKTKQVTFFILAAGIGIAVWNITNRFFTEGAEAFLGIIPGLIFLGLTIITKNKIGFADGLTLIFIGAVDGYRVCVFSLIIGLMMLSMISIVLLVLKKVKKESQIPFIPFLLLARIIAGMMGI